MFLGSIIALIFHKKFNVHRKVVFGRYQSFFFESHSRKDKTYTQINHIVVKN